MPISSKALAFLAIASLGLYACADRAGDATGPEPPREGAAHEPALELVESWPVDTSLDHPDIADAHQVWIEMIESAERSLDLEEFYGSTSPGSRLEDVIAAIERAAARGVKVRALFGARFYETQYRDVPDRLAALPGAEMRIIDLGPHSSGVQHSKFFVVDGEEAYIGSQNFDWRALTHIQELGVRIRHPGLANVALTVFEFDWELAAGGADALERARATTRGKLAGAAPVIVPYKGEDIQVSPGISPAVLIPDAEPGPVPARWDLPRMVALIDGANERVRIQALSYATHEYDGGTFTDIDQALRRAAARGVTVELMLSDWNMGAPQMEALAALQRLPGITVKLVTIPEHAGGFIPFARVIHSKLMTADRARSWLGTSNISGDYFHHSRNIGLFFEGASMTADLDRFFDTVWQSEYAFAIDPERSYPKKRIAE